MLTLILSCLAVAYVLYRSHTKPKIHRNGAALRHAPNSLPFAGNGLHFLNARHKLFDWFVRCERKFGFETFEIHVPSLPPGVVINDPKNLEFVFKNENIFQKGDFVKSRSWDLFGNGIVNADGEIWKVQRKAGLQFLNTSNMRFLTESVLPVLTDNICRRLQSVRVDDIVDLDTIFHELTTQIMGQMAYGMEMHSADPFSLAFEYASGETGKRFQNPLWRVTEVFFGSKFRKAIAEVKLFGNKIVTKAIESRRGLQETKPDVDHSDLDGVSGSLINALLDSISDFQVVADAALNYLSAGRDTTAQSLSWTFYLLMRHPNVIQSLREEYRKLQIVGNGRVTVAPQSIPFVMAVFYEALRMHPPVPFEIKQCEQDTTLPDGTFLPKTSVLVWCTWAMNRSKIAWGDDVDFFKPERWLHEGKLITKTASEFPVFNGGTRTCLGKKMAENMAVTVILKLALEFDFIAVDGKERVSKTSLTLPMEGGLPCYVRKFQPAQVSV